MEKTFVMLKPDAVNRGLSGEIISRLENKGLKMVAAKFMMVSENLAKTHYSEHEGKNFFESLIDYITSGPSFAMVFEGDQAISVCRTVVGATDPKVALPGTIRGDYGMDKGRNLIHASDSLESAKREINLFFKSNEILEYEHHSFKWIYE